jgi:hypothetical protein
MGYDMSRLARILLFALALSATLAPVSCKKPVAPPDAAKLSSNDYGTRARAIEQLMRSDFSTMNRFSDRTYAEIDRALKDFPDYRSHKSGKFLRQIQIQRQKAYESTLKPDRVTWDVMIDVYANFLDQDGIPK